MPAVWNIHNLHVGSDQLDLVSERKTIRFLSAQRKHRHRELRLREFFKILRRLWKGNEVGPARTHSSRTRVSRGVSPAHRLRYRVILVRSEVVPVVLEISTLTSSDECFRRRTIESKVPNSRTVVDGLPVADARKK